MKSANFCLSTQCIQAESSRFCDPKTELHCDNVSLRTPRACYGDRIALMLIAMHTRLTPDHTILGRVPLSVVSLFSNGDFVHALLPGQQPYTSLANMLEVEHDIVTNIELS